MGILGRLFGGGKAAMAPQASTQSPSGGRVIANSWQLDEYLRSEDGGNVDASSALKAAAVYACVRILSGPPATLPFPLKRKIDARTREDASDNPVSLLLNRRPNRWQTPSQFRRMMQAHVLLRGNAVAYKVPGVKGPQELIPLHPDRVKIEQNDDLSLKFTWTRKDGLQQVFKQSEVLHLVNLTLDGIVGVTPITYARETIGLSLVQERHGALQFKNGLNTGGYLSSAKALGKEGRANLREAMDEFRSVGGARAGEWMILEDDVKANTLAMTAEDAQWIDSRKFSRSDIAMFFGVPPHMIGDTDKSTSWGTGLEQQSLGFVTYTLEDYLTMWEQACNRDLLGASNDLYFRYNRAAMVRGDIAARYQAYQIGRQIEMLSANDCRAAEDMNPVEGGDTYANPAINTKAGGQNDPAKTS